MRIDERVEPVVREGLQAAVRRDVDRLDRAMKAFPDETSRVAGAQLLMAVSAYVLVDLYGGQRPTDDQIQALASKVAENEEWSNLAPGDVAGFLRLVLGNQAKQIDPVTAGLLAFVVTASLLIGRPVPEGKHWFNYLDQVEAALEVGAD